MFDDDNEPKNKVGTQVKILDPLSIEELHTYISDLKNEIERAEGEIRRKIAVRDAAASIFKN